MSEINTTDKTANSKGDNVTNIQALASVVEQLEKSFDSWNGWVLFFTFATAFAAAGYFAVSCMANVRGKQLKNAQTALMEAKDTQLTIDLKAKDVDIANAQKAAAEANRIAEGERLARLKLEEKLAWRKLTPEQQNRIASKIKSFDGQKYDLFVVNEAEPMNMLRIVDDILQKSGWKKVPPTDPNQIIVPDLWAAVSEGSRTKISIQVAPSQEANLGNRATTLASALEAEGIAAFPSKNPDNERRQDIISIVIGTKPHD